MVVAAELGALAAVDAPASEILNQVWFTWPGTASAFPPSFGIHQECITSEEVMSSVTVVSIGTTIS